MSATGEDWEQRGDVVHNKVRASVYPEDGLLDCIRDGRVAGSR